MSNQSLTFLEDIKWVHDGSPVDVVYLDQGFVIKLKSYSTGESVICWTQTRWTNREQRVIVEGRYQTKNQF